MWAARAQRPQGGEHSLIQKQVADVVAVPVHHDLPLRNPPFAIAPFKPVYVAAAKDEIVRDPIHATPIELRKIGRSENLLDLFLVATHPVIGDQIGLDRKSTRLNSSH